MDRRTFLSTIAASAGVMALGGAARASAESDARRPPNFVVILADDISAFDLGCYGCADHATPNLDRLAETGVRFRTCWATPICTPSRTELLTGKYGFRTKVFHNAMRYYGTEPQGHLGNNHTLISELLKARGYATCLVGKWQLDGTYPTKVFDYGFDEYLIHHEWMHDLPTGAVFDGLVSKEGDLFPGLTSEYWHPCLVRNGELVDTQPNDYAPDLFVDHVIDFMGRHKDQPFLAYYPMCLAHTQPDFLGDGKECNVPVPELDSHGRRTGRRTPAGLKYNIEYIDHLVGRIVRALDAMGLRENTLVIFSSDNASIRFGKASPTEQAALVPMICNGPGLVTPLGAVNALTDLSDVYATLAEYAGIPMPAGETFDGKSLGPVLRAEAPRSRDWIFSFLACDRWLRDERWYRDAQGRFYDCGDNRSGEGYTDVTDSSDQEVVAARRRFDEILAGLPAPDPVADKFILDRYKSEWEEKLLKRIQEYARERGEVK